MAIGNTNMYTDTLRDCDRTQSHVPRRHLSLAARFMLLCFICVSRLCAQYRAKSEPAHSSAPLTHYLSRVVKRILKLVKVSGGGGHVMLLDCRLLMRRHAARQRDAVPLLEGVERLDRARRGAFEGRATPARGRRVAP